MIGPSAVGCKRLLAIAPIAGTGRTNRHEIVISDRAEIVYAKSDQGLRSTRCRDELHSERIGAIDFHYRAEVTLAQALRRKIACEHDDVERMNLHWASPG